MVRNRSKALSRWLRVIIIGIVCMMMTPFCAVPVNADVATDYISVRVGYLGMELDEYVLVGKYHWSELMNNLPTYEIAYSYFQNGQSKKHYTAVVDSANGFMVSDLLSYADIYYGDVRNLKFYVEDHKGIQAAFDRDALFSTRYYFDDLAGHRSIEYDENNNVVSYSFDDAWSASYKVEPMLALEDNWESFNEEFEHIGPNFESMGSGSRFRLEFGQKNPTESMTSSSAKYVSCVYVTLDGKPKVGDMPELQGSYGSHETEITVSADNQSIRDALSEVMKINSTNKDVLVITEVKVTKSDVYSDLATVKIKYDIVGKGEASITVGMGSDSNTIASSSVVHGEAKAEKEQEQNKPDSEDEKEKADSKETDNNTERESGSSDNNAKAGNSAGSVDRDAKTGSSSALDKRGAKEKINNIEEIDPEVKSSTYVLSRDAQQKLEEMLNSGTVTEAAEEVTEVKQKEDKSGDRQKKMILITSLGGIGLCGMGGAAEFVSFRVRLNRRVRIRKA